MPSRRPVAEPDLAPAIDRPTSGAPIAPTARPSTRPAARASARPAARPAGRRPREDDLLRAATQLFRRLGFHATSMEDLARALGMNRGSLYHYIAAKDDLLWRIVSGAMGELDRAVRPILTGPGPATERLRRAIAAHLRFAARSADALSILQIELRALSPERRATLIAQRDAYEAMWRAAIAQGIEDGEFRSVDVPLTGMTILSACNWFTQWFRPDGRLSEEEIAAQMADLFVRGLASPGLAATWPPARPQADGLPSAGDGTAARGDGR